MKGLGAADCDVRWNVRFEEARSSLGLLNLSATAGGTLSRLVLQLVKEVS